MTVLDSNKADAASSVSDGQDAMLCIDRIGYDLYRVVTDEFVVICDGGLLDEVDRLIMDETMAH